MAFSALLTLRGLTRARLLALPLALTLTLAAPAQAQLAASGSAAQRAATYFNSIRSQPPLLWAFLKDMPKGGDLHSHLSGAIYAESLIAWAAEGGVCVDQKTLATVKPPCNEAQGSIPAAQALTDGVLYRRLIDAWSMRNVAQSGLSGHDQFFDSFGKFKLSTQQRDGDMLAEVAARASAGKVSYLELMLTPASAALAKVVASSGWNDDLSSQHAALRAAGLADAVQAASADIRHNLARQRDILGCTRQPGAAGCEVAVRILYQVLRGLPRETVFAQMVAGFELAQSDPNVVGLNMVMPEDGMVSMRDFRQHMRMLDYLHGAYPKGRVTLHAGELAPGLVPPEGLRFHIRESVLTGHARRIGHGVDILQEDDALGLLRRMARDQILVEICLTSNTGILGVSGANHPMAAYLKYGVPLALATDDEGVARSEMTAEYVKAAVEQHVDYPQLKTMARNSLQYSFAEGDSLWADAKRLRPVAACANDRPPAARLSSSCRAYLAQHTKARLQWQLEADLHRFESSY
ncbi:MAG: adenosine deaminase [Sphingomonadaceae bacterium]